MPTLPRSPLAEGPRVQNVRVANSEVRVSGNDPVADALTGAGNAAFEATSRIREAHITAEVGKAQNDLRLRLDSEYRALEADNGDPAELEAKFQERATAVLGETSKGMSSPMHKRLFEAQAADLRDGYLLKTRDLTRTKQLGNARALAMQTLDDLAEVAADTSIGEDVLQANTDNFLAMAREQFKVGAFRAEQLAEAEIKAESALKGGISARVLSETDRKIENGQIAEAEEFFKVNYGRILPEKREAAEKVFRAQTREAKAFAKADEIWNGSRNKDGTANYAAAIEKARGITDMETRSATETRLAQLAAQDDAAVSAKDTAGWNAGMEFITSGRPVPASLMRDASPKVRDLLQSEQRQRDQWNQTMATLSAQERAAMNQTSMGNYRILKAQLNNKELAAAGLDAILADPAMQDRWNNMTTDEQGAFYLDATNAQANGGIPADAASKAYRDVMALAGVNMPTNTIIPQSLTRRVFSGAGEGDPGKAEISSTRSKTAAAVVLEGEVMRLVTEELERTGGAPISEDRAKQIIAMSYATVGGDGTGRTAFPVTPEVAAGVAVADARSQIIAFRRDQPAVYSKLRREYPDASDAVLLEEARKLQAMRAARSGADAIGSLFAPKPKEGE